MATHQSVVSLLTLRGPRLGAHQAFYRPCLFCHGLNVTANEAQITTDFRQEATDELVASLELPDMRFVASSPNGLRSVISEPCAQARCRTKIDHDQIETAMHTTHIQRPMPEDDVIRGSADVEGLAWSRTTCRGKGSVHEPNCHFYVGYE